MNRCRLRIAKLRLTSGAAVSTAMAVDPTPARVNSSPPRWSVSSAVRDAATVDDQKSTTAGFPFSAATETSGAGNGSYIQVARGVPAGAATVDDVRPVDRGLNGSVLISPS